MRKKTMPALAAPTGSVGAALMARVSSTGSTLALLSASYESISKRCRRLGSDVFETRLMLT